MADQEDAQEEIVERILDRTSANRVLRLMAEEERELKALEEQYKDELSALHDRYTKMTERHYRRLDWLHRTYDVPLRLFAEKELEGKKEKSITLLNGRIGFRTSPPKLEIFDGKEVEQWAEVSLPEAVHKEIRYAPIRQWFKRTGEAPPGTAVVEGTTEFYIRTAAQEKEEVNWTEEPTTGR